MSFRLAIAAGICSIVLTILPPKSIQAQPKAAVAAHGVVDVVTLKSGTNLRGGIASSVNGKLLMVVALNWYQESQPAKAATALQDNIAQRRLAWTQARDRLKTRMNAPLESPPLRFFLQSELERIEQALADRNPADPDFVWIEIPQPQVAKVLTASPEQQRLALFAWSEGLAHVETRDAAAIKKELEKNGVNLKAAPPELAERLVPRPQDEREWDARMALVEYGLSKPLDFQGSGDALTRTQAGQQANLAEILPKLLEQQLGSLLKDLTGDNPSFSKPAADKQWLAPAIRVAEAEKARGFRVTRVSIDSMSSRIGVETQFVTQRAGGDWKPIWRVEVVEDGNQQRPAAEARIEQDPQVKMLLETIKSVGLIDQNVVRQAIRVGAATMAAQEAADGQFSQFRNRYVNRLDAPPLPIDWID